MNKSKMTSRSRRSSTGRSRKLSDNNDEAIREVFVDANMKDSIAEYWMREFAKAQYLEKCKAVGVSPDHEHSPRQVLKNTKIMLDTWKYWREEPNCTGVDFWIGSRDKEVHAYPRLVISSHIGSHPQTR